MHFITLVPTFFAWWYGRGLKDLFAFLIALLNYLQNMFSVTTLLKTLFSPWKKMVEEKGRGLQGLWYWILDNLISRGIGFVVRVIMILLFIMVFILFLVFSFVAIIFWIGMPAIVVISFFYLFIGDVKW